MQILRSDQRGRARHGWLDSHHSFSFGHYYDPARMGFGVLRVINDDRVAPGAGFPTHPHRDMEIVTYVVEGALEHRDTLGTGSVIRPGEVQRMSAGRGIAHSEFNASQDEALRLLQIWILPAARATPPSYAQRAFAEPRDGTLQLLVSPTGEGDSIDIGQQVRILRYKPPGADQPGSFTLPAGRSGWLQVVRSELSLTTARGERVALTEGDGVALPAAGDYRLDGRAGAEALCFELPEVNHD